MAKGRIQNVPLVYRVVKKDNVAFPHTTDYRTDRVNVTINNGIVTDAYIG